MLIKNIELAELHLYCDFSNNHWPLILSVKSVCHVLSFIQVLAVNTNLKEQEEEGNGLQPSLALLTRTLIYGKIAVVIRHYSLPSCLSQIVKNSSQCIISDKLTVT